MASKEERRLNALGGFSCEKFCVAEIFVTRFALLV